MRAIFSAAFALLLSACAPMPSGDIRPGERPALDTTEAGLWMRMDSMEERLKGSGRVVEDAELNAYLREIVCRLEPSYCPDIRIYIVDVPYFNATMAPNGMMQIWTGLLLRVENEAQLAFVLGHELAHYVRRHSLQRWIDIQNKVNAAFVFSILTSAAGVGYVGTMGELAAISSVLAFSREQEREADALGTAHVVAAGYDSREAVRIWRALEAERAASEKPETAIFLSTHPGVEERIAYLEAASTEQAKTGGRMIVGRRRLTAEMAPFQDEWLGDELTRGDLAESEVLFLRLLETTSQRGLVLFHLGELYRKRGEEGDSDRAIEAYRSALAEPDVPARTHRSLGQSLMRAGKRREARAALENYLLAAPDAYDRLIIQYQIESLR